VQTALVTIDQAAVERMWTEFAAATGEIGPYVVWGFAYGSDPALMTELGLLVRDGPKRATAGRAEDFSPDGEKLPGPGDLNVIHDGDGNPICIIRTTSVQIQAFGKVDAQFAWDEGEGDRSLESWRAAPIRFFASVGTPIDDDTNLVLERFAKVWPPPVDAPA
jgi:uncharacterized protein YhfF